MDPFVFLRIAFENQTKNFNTNSFHQINKDTLQIPKRKRRQKEQARLFMTVLCNEHQVQRRRKFTLK